MVEMTRVHALLHVPASVPLDEIHRRREALAGELMVDLEFDEDVDGR